ncbi:MAG TPA: phage portal protein [Tepidisphaeraceae bacterium]|nr:phage portal protein [Tepidisphaeraceae bacterium]
MLVKLDACACDEYRAWAAAAAPPVNDAPPAREPTTQPAADAPACGTSDLGRPPVPATDGRAPSEDTGPAPCDDDPIDQPDLTADATPPAPPVPPDVLPRLARMIRLEVVEPARALPVLSPHDYRQVDAYAQVYRVHRPVASGPRRVFKTAWIDRVKRSATGLLGAVDPTDPAPRPTADNGGDVLVVDVLSAHRWRRYEAGQVVAEGVNALGVLPLVHVQNVGVPFEYAGASDVEPLLPLQDELNTRLSDRAYRITMQSFRMYLGKGIDGFATLPVAPGRMWSTDNPDAQVIEFGGDSAAPSEEAHVAELREALDKTSGVNPIAAGAIKGRIGRLTSAAALRVTMQTLLAKTEKKRTTYGAAIERMCELALAWLDVAGAFTTTSDERKVELSWPSPVPENKTERLQEAEAKVRLGVDRAVVLRELGY